jgi:ATP-dependent Clp protease adaptor protein ClpS
MVGSEHITEKRKKKQLLDSGDGEIGELVVHNDEVNTFDWVITSFVEILKHSSEQAEQLSLIIHFKGKATVKTSPIRVLKPLKQALIDRGLSVTIEALEV